MVRKVDACQVLDLRREGLISLEGLKSRSAVGRESFPKKVWFPQKHLQAVDFLVLPPVKSLNRRKQLPPPQPCWFL